MEAASHDVEVERIKTVKKIIEKENCIVVTSIEALLHQLPSPTLYTKNRINLKIGATVDLANIIETFILQGYERMDTVEERGQFSIRGDIIDIFPGSSEVPFRIELFGDEIDSIRRFEVNTQRSMDKVDFVKVYPAKEMGIKDLNVEEIISKLHRDYKSISKKLDMDAKQNLKEKFGETVEKLKELRNFKGIEKLLPYICKKPDTLLDYFDKDAIFILDDPNRLREKSKGYIDEFYQNFNVLIERGEIFPKQGELILSYNEIIERLKEHKLIVLSLLPKTIKDFPPKGIINFNTRPMQSFNGKMGFLVKEIKKLQYKGYKIVLVPGTKERANRLLELLKDNKINAKFVTTERKTLVTGEIIIVSGNLRKGFEYVKNKYALITDFEIYGVHKRRRKITKRKDASLIKSSVDLSIGDYVVHEGHGIGKYVGIEELSIEGAKKEYFKIAYLGEDFLYVPTDQVDYTEVYR